MSGKGLDVGTNMIVAAHLDDSNRPVYKKQRDAFFVIRPKTDVNRNTIKKVLDKRKSSYIISNNDFIVVGEDALEMAMERNEISKRPIRSGVISPKDKENLPILKSIINSILGTGKDNEKLMYSVPAEPIDSKLHFDIIYHQEMLKKYLKELKYDAHPINEAFAIGISELLDDGLTGICLSFGAGMVNVSVLHNGESLIEFSLTKSGDFIDNSVGVALDISPSVVQLEKESGIDLNNPKGKVAEAVVVYYEAVMDYSLKTIAHELNSRKLPRFRNEVPIIVSGGLTKAVGFVDVMSGILSNISFPVAIEGIRQAKDPITCVANGALLASQI